MKVFESELKYLEELYDLLEARLETQFQGLRDSKVAECFEEREEPGLLSRITGMDDRIYQLRTEWKRYESELPPELKEEVSGRVAKLERRIPKLQVLLERNEILLREIQSSTREAIAEVRTGAQYLNSVRGPRDNRPRFIDSQQ